MPDSEASQLALLAYRLDRAEAEIKEMHEEMDRREAEEQRRLIWGIGVLGAAVLSLAGVIWNWRSVILRGTP